MLMPNWKTKFAVKDLLTDISVGREQAVALGAKLAERLEESDNLFGTETVSLINLFRHDCFSQADFNEHLSRLYDVADEQRIWIE
jgi:hypothetical protein